MKKPIILSDGVPKAGSGWQCNLTQDLIKTAGGVDAKVIRSKYHLERLLNPKKSNIGTLSYYRKLPVLIPLIVEPGSVIKVHTEWRSIADKLIAAKVILPT
jgi:hypothetical protein